MIRRGHRVTAVVLRATGGDDQMHDLLGLGATVRLVEHSRWKAIGSSALALATNVPLQVAFCRSDRQSTLVRALVESGEIDLVHVEHLRAARCALGISDIPRVYDGVDCMTLLWSRTADNGLPSRRLLAKLELPRTRHYEAYVLRNYGRVLVTSNADAAAMNALAPNVIPTVIGNGVDHSYFEALPWKPEPGRLVFFGRMSYHANQQAVTNIVNQILPQVQVRCPEARLTIAGASPNRGVRRLSRRNGVTVTGHLPDLRPILAQTAVALCPMSVAAGVQNKILEAMSAGVPVVTSALAAGPLGLIHNEHVIIADGPAATVDAVSSLLEDHELAVRLHTRGRDYVRTHFSWGQVADRLESVYEEARRLF